MSRLDKGVKRPEGRACLTVTALQKKRRQEHALEAVDADSVEHAAVRGSSGIWSETMAKELMFQKNKMYDCKVEKYLENALLEDEIDPELVDVALKLRETQNKNDQQRTAKEKRVQNLLIPNKFCIQSRKFHLEDHRWLQKVEAGSRHNVMILPWDAENWIVADPTNPTEQILWSACLLGGLVCDINYFDSRAENGLAIHFTPFIDMARKLYFSHAFRQEHSRAAEVLQHCLVHRRSKVVLLNSWEEFADQHCRLPPKKIMSVIAVASDAEASRVNEKNILSKKDFVAFMCRMSFAKRNICGM